MSENKTKVPGWGWIILILVAVAVISGVLLALIGETLGLSPAARTVGVGAMVGIVAAILIGRRRAGT